MIRRLFTDHPASVGESYLEHMGVAGSFGKQMLIGGLACFVHAFIPGLCVKTGSTIVGQLHHRMVTHRTPSAAPSDHGNV